MKILILEDEPLIALDIEDIVHMTTSDAQCVVATTLAHAIRAVQDGDVDFALLDINLGEEAGTAFPVAAALMGRQIPFCFVSSDGAPRPHAFAHVPFVAKPYPSEAIAGAVRRYA